MLKSSLVGLFLWLFFVPAWAEFAVIAHPSVAADVTKEDVAKIFLAKSKKLPGGEAGSPLNLKQGDAARESFEKSVLGKSPSQVKAYWSTLIFTGKAVPIEEATSDADVVAKVAANPGAIGYVDASAVTDAVSVLFTY